MWPPPAFIQIKRERATIKKLSLIFEFSTIGPAFSQKEREGDFPQHKAFATSVRRKALSHQNCRKPFDFDRFGEFVFCSSIAVRCDPLPFGQSHPLSLSLSAQ